MNTAGNVLLADDEDLFRVSTATFLRPRMVSPATALENGPQAIELLRKNRYDVLLPTFAWRGTRSGPGP